MDFSYTFDQTAQTIALTKTGLGYTAQINGETHTVATVQVASDGALTFSLAGQTYVAYVASEGPRRWVWVNGQTYVLQVPDTKKKAKRGGASGHDTLTAQMPGLVRSVAVSVDEIVERGQTLLVLEAMKMEIRIAAPHAGKVAQVCVAAGQAVERGQLLVDIEAAEA